MEPQPQPVVEGVLLLYHRPLWRRDARSVVDHIQAFRRHSRFPVWEINTELGFPAGLAGLRFRAVVLHYSLFGEVPYPLDEAFLAWLRSSPACHRVAFFQDEHHGCGARFDFLERHGVDCVYTLLAPEEARAVYGRCARVQRLVTTLPGYVGSDLVAAAERWARPDAERTIDVGYRGRRLPFYMGRGAQEKHRIAVEFRRAAAGHGLRLDIETDEAQRRYGDDWYDFLGRCRAVLGVEAGASVFDLDGQAQRACEELLAARPAASFDEVADRALAPYEDRIRYRTIGPRHLEAAAFRVCQVLFEGDYSGILRPGVHYLALRKDFSNVEQVIAQVRDPAVRRELVENAYRDVIASGICAERRFVEEFDRELAAAGLAGHPGSPEAERVDAVLARGRGLRELAVRAKTLHQLPFPGRRRAARLARWVLRRCRELYRGRPRDGSPRG